MTNADSDWIVLCPPSKEIVPRSPAVVISEVLPAFSNFTTIGEPKTFRSMHIIYYLIQNSQAVKKVCGPQKGYGEKRCEIQGGGQEMAVMVG